MRHYYETSFRHYKLAVRTYVRSSSRRRFWFHFQMWGMFVLGLILVFMVILFNSRSHYFATIAAPVAAGLLAGGAVAVFLRPWQLRRCYKAWNGEVGDRQLFIDVTGSELLSGIEGRNETRFQRNAVCAVAEDENTLLLFLNKKKFLYFAKAAVPHAALDEIHEWIALPGAPPQC